jgi:hypothetical protein
VETIHAVADPTPDGIPAEDCVAASRYIAAIVARDPRAAGDPGFAARLTRQLWDRFGIEHRSIASGPYARQGHVALRIALGRL